MVRRHDVATALQQGDRERLSALLPLTPDGELIFRDLDLANIQIPDMDLAFSQFDRVNLSGSRFDRTGLQSTRFSKSSLRNVHMDRCLLACSKWVEIDLEGAVLERLQFADGHVLHTSFCGAVIDFADSNGCRFEDVWMDEAKVSFHTHSGGLALTTCPWLKIARLMEGIPGVLPGA